MISTGQGRLPRRGTTEERLTGGEGAKKLFGAPPPQRCGGWGGLGVPGGSVLFCFPFPPFLHSFHSQPNRKLNEYSKQASFTQSTVLFAAA